jgi:hypothetical protein
VLAGGVRVEGVEGVEGRVDITDESIDLFATDQSTDEQRSVMADPTADGFDREILSSDLRYQLAREEIVDGVRPLGSTIWEVGALKRVVTQPHDAGLDLPVALDLVLLGQVSDLVDDAGAMVRAGGRLQVPGRGRSTSAAASGCESCWPPQLRRWSRSRTCAPPRDSRHPHEE